MKFWQVDSFTTKPFKGNPAAVFVLETDIPDDLKQNIAMEMNLSETAFVVLGREKHGLRWMTPNAEVNLCGHATLAAAHILWEEGYVQKGEGIIFDTRSGDLRVELSENGYEMRFPSQPAKTIYDGDGSHKGAGQEMKEALKDSSHGTALCKINKHFNPIFIGSNGEDCLAVYGDEADILHGDMDIEAVRDIPERGLIVTARSSRPEYDYIYRTFYPKLNVPEDPVTGSANTCLIPYWSSVLGKDTLKAYQASQRGGELAVQMDGEHVLVSGQAITIIKGEIKL